MRLPSRLLAALTVAAALATTGAPASAVVAGEADEVVGGPDLAGRGVVVDPAAPALPQVGAAGWLVADLDTGEVLAARDPHGRYAPASTLKTLTAVALIPELPADGTAVPTFADVAVDGSKVGLVEKAAYPVSELFHALLMVSGNDAANVLASAAGGQQRTAELMNATARELRALDTRAVNPHGLDAEGQLSSPYDLALIARAGLAMPDFARYVSTRKSSVGAPGGKRIEIYNKNKLLRDYPGALGVKNGFTNAARASFVGAAERDGRRLVVTLMRSVPKVFGEAEKLLDWGFAARGIRPVGVLVEPVTAELPEQAAVPQVPVTPAARAAAAPDPGTPLPVVLGGLGLAAAALLTVRRRPGDARRLSASPAGARPPAQRRPPASRSAARPGSRRR